MKQIIASGLLSLTMLVIAGCGEETNNTQEQTSATTAIPAKTAKTNAPASKCSSGKCGTGKCGTTNNKMTP